MSEISMKGIYAKGMFYTPSPTKPDDNKINK